MIAVVSEMPEREPLTAEAAMAKAAHILMDVANPSLQDIMLADALVRMARELSMEQEHVDYHTIYILAEEPRPTHPSSGNLIPIRPDPGVPERRTPSSVRGTAE